MLTKTESELHLRSHSGDVHTMTLRGGKWHEDDHSVFVSHVSNCTQLEPHQLPLCPAWCPLCESAASCVLL